ncbi:hypothetical protein MMC08_004804 [Hypocenomyce scalaris]|nr:hypothetical protein [Hypocenomyce scalaris]
MTSPAAAGHPAASDVARIPILLLKTRSNPTDGYHEYFSKPPFTPTFVPVLEHSYNSAALAHVKGLLCNGSFGSQNPKYGGLIFTSQRAVEAFTSVVTSLASSCLSPPANPPLAELNIPLYTVGPATSRALTAVRDAHLPLCTVEGAESGNGEALAHFILSNYTGRAQFQNSNTALPKRLPLLFLVGEQRRDIIPRTLQSSTHQPEDRIDVEELVVYETGVMASFAEDFCTVLARTGEANCRWVVVFSPTGCKGMLRELAWLAEGTAKVKSRNQIEEDGGEGREERRTFVASIGPTTRDYLDRQFGFEVDVCAEVPSPEGVGRGIERFVREKGLV